MSIRPNGPAGMPVAIIQARSTSWCEATPWSTSCRHSFLIARQTRLKTKPVLSLRSMSGVRPSARAKWPARAMVSLLVCVPPISSTIGRCQTGR